MSDDSYMKKMCISAYTLSNVEFGFSKKRAVCPLTFLVFGLFNFKVTEHFILCPVEGSIFDF